uniref:PGG domain-containing protein n=1 Tax=Oryza punctata TaxID=4537 RepID=A0A0E0L906_ORYPU
MTSCVPPIVISAFSILLWALQSLESFLAASSETSPSLDRGAQLTAGALFFTILIAVELTCLLLFTYVGDLGAAGGAGHGGFIAVAIATLAIAAVAALLAGAVLPFFSARAAEIE